MTFSWLAVVFILWAGVLLGVSFIATPVKFMAPHLTMPVALEVGKATFHVFNKVEWLLLVFAILSVYFHKPLLLKWGLVGILALLMALETAWLLPALDIRTDMVIAGQPASPGKLHWLYITADGLKLITLLGGSWWFCVRSST